MRVPVGAHRGQPRSGSALSLARDNPDVARGARCEDGRVGTTVLIVDDHRDFRTFARALLEAGGFEVVGEAVDGASALVAARALKPTLVLLDVQLPDIDGFAVCEQLAGDAGPPVVVLTSTRDASSYRRRLGASSARGFIAKAELSGPRLATFAGAG
jgi:DNA-binding NarL/FixJ family response regulator